MQVTLRQLIQEAAVALNAKGIENSQREAALLLAFVLDVSTSHLYAWPEKIPTEAQSISFAECVRRRRLNEPVSYITGKREFWSLMLEVTPATLIPRPETELLVETALSLGDRLKRNIVLADLGTGSGAIALALLNERPNWAISAVDNSREALEIAKRNAVNLHLQGVQFYYGDWCDALPRRGYDIIVSNPPYISEVEWPDYAEGLHYEPHTALISGKDGLDAIREISASARDYLHPGGFLLVEHGVRQALLVRDIFVSKGYTNVQTLCDLEGRDRMTLGAQPELIC